MTCTVTNYVFLCMFLLTLMFPRFSLQLCLEEVTHKGYTVRWPQSSEQSDIQSEPLCYDMEKIITRDCVNGTWIPSTPDLPPCFRTFHINELDRTSSICPPGFEEISHNNTEYCYQIGKSSSWSYPCLHGGGASVITNLNDYDVTSLLNSLRKMNVSRYFWLPARRSKLFSPMTWYIPGKMWGREVQSYNLISIQATILKSCLLLDIDTQKIISELCVLEYPSICFYSVNIHTPARCPKNYHGVRFAFDASICFGIEMSNTSLTFDEFLNETCTPMGDEMEVDLSRYLYKDLAHYIDLPDDEWCWFSTSYSVLMKHDSLLEYLFRDIHVSINKNASLNFIIRSSDTKLNCMACQTQILYEEPYFTFQYSHYEKIIYLTIYYPSGLWKYHRNDTGIQCFSDAKGFEQVIEIYEIPFMEVNDTFYSASSNTSTKIEKKVYTIELITDRSAQYWCEGHSKNFSLVTTNKMVVNPQGNNVHVFALTMKVYISNEDIQNEYIPKMKELSDNLTSIFNAEKVLLMETVEYNTPVLQILMHLHVPIEEIYETKGLNIKYTYEELKRIALVELPKYNYTFISLLSSLYCLPTKSDCQSVALDWELTPIGQIAAPKQFCLQANGLPVKRVCGGSYLHGGTWGVIEGTCNQNYSPTATTTFLYEFLRGRVPEIDRFRFLTDGLAHALNDVDKLIPADIYYLSISLQLILDMAQKNESSIDMGTISNIAWIMNRIMILDNDYLRLAQTLNSTNVILDSIGEIIELLALKPYGSNTKSVRKSLQPYELSVQPQFLVQISHPAKYNVSGLAIQRTKNSKNFMDMNLIPLHMNTTYEEILKIENLEIATWVPENVLKSLRRIENTTTDNDYDEQDIHVIIYVFDNDAVFQALDPTDYLVNSGIVSVSIPGYVSNFAKPIPLIFKNIEPTDYQKTCGYWDFDIQKNVPGFWSNKGCFLQIELNDTTVCHCYHLTHFGQLINIRERVDKEDIYEPNLNTQPLNIISITGSFLSLLGIAGIWITAFVFHAWRKKPGTKVLLNLTAAIAMPLILIVVFNLDSSIFTKIDDVYYISENKEILCIFLGALLHYSVLASFMWMLITASLQFTRYVRVLGVGRPSRFIIKFTLIGWGIPIIPVATVLIFDSKNYVPNLPFSKFESAICYPKDFFLKVSVILPICIILLINIILFISVLYAISHGPDGKVRTTDLDLIGAQLRLSIFLFFLLGLTWIFGIFSFTSNLIWSYFFCLTSTLQGFVLFVYFIICDPVTRNLWVTLMKPQFRSAAPRESVTSITSSQEITSSPPLF